MIVPLVEAEATKVPSALTARAPTSDSCAFISTDEPFSLTIERVRGNTITVV